MLTFVDNLAMLADVTTQLRESPEDRVFEYDPWNLESESDVMAFIQRTVPDLAWENTQTKFSVYHSPFTNQVYPSIYVCVCVCCVELLDLLPIDQVQRAISHLESSRSIPAAATPTQTTPR
jgi:hypothetical protein